jgi:segregation and condensation protein B
VQEDGLRASPDSALMEAEIQVPAHQPYDMDIVERIVQRYENILEFVGNAQQKNEKKDGL